jgi:hypothetical protein
MRFIFHCHAVSGHDHARWKSRSAFAGALGLAAAIFGSAVVMAQSSPVAPRELAKNGMAPEALQQCLAELKQAGGRFEELGRFEKEGCVLDGAVALDVIASTFGDINISGKPVMLCSFARQFTLWVTEAGAPLTLAYTGKRLRGIETGPGLVCRNRYNKSDEKVSEHAKGNALDIAAFLIEGGKRIAVGEASKGGGLDGKLMRAFRATGCGYFTTILGPGSNAAHEEHLHFDYGLHGKSTNYRICE